jgi:hypothetical protein
VAFVALSDTPAVLDNGAHQSAGALMVAASIAAMISKARGVAIVSARCDSSRRIDPVQALAVN